MSGPFQRIARRGADRPDTSNAPTPVDATDAPTEQFTAVDTQPTTDTPETDALAADTPTADARPADAADGPATAEAPAVPTTEAPVTPPVPVPAAPTVAATPSPAPAQPTELQPTIVAPERRPGFRERGQMRRRLRYLRKLRELQVRDLGGLAFDLRRYERKRDDLIAQKIDQIRACDDELRALEAALEERRDVRDVREPGIGGTCPRCFAIHGSNDRFCASCGAALGGAVQGPAQVPALPPTAPPAAPPTAPPPPVKAIAAPEPPAAPPAPGAPSQ